MKKRGRWIVLAVLALVTIAILWVGPWSGAVTSRGADPSPDPPERVVPAATRIRVEVLNASGARGVARRATAFLRDVGFDVVGSGNAPARADSTVVLVHSGRMEWGALAAKALGGARVEARPDSSRHLDLTILLGADWRPPPEPFDP